MASSHRVTDLEKIPVRITKGRSSDAVVSSWAFVYFLLVISSFSSLVRCVAFQSFSFCLLCFHNRLDLIGEPAFYWMFYFIFPIYLCFIICKNENVLFVLVQ